MVGGSRDIVYIEIFSPYHESIKRIEAWIKSLY